MFIEYKIKSLINSLRYRDKIKFVKISYNGRYHNYEDSNDIEMCILGLFLSSDVSCTGTIFREWALREDWYGCGGNITVLEKEDGYIYLSDLCSQEIIPTRLRMTIQQFVQLLDDWQEKVCKAKPKEVLIKHENGEFVIETSN